MRPIFWGQTPEQFKSWGKSKDMSEHLQALIMRQYWKRKSMEIPPWAMGLLQDEFSFALPLPVATQSAPDGTIKFLFEFEDHSRIETVLVPLNGKYSVCLSTQVGCAMGCKFCFTALQGFKRNLQASEIVGQYWYAWNYLREHRPELTTAPKIVLMGQGEPLHNFEQLKMALEILLSHSQVALGPRNVTLSSAGYLPGLKRLNELPPVNLALSLHSPFDEERTSLIPINARYPLKDVLHAMDQRAQLKRQYINFEYLLIHNFNDSPAHMQALADIVKPRPAMVNIIPFNPVPGLNFQRPSFEQAHEVQKSLRRLGVFATVRTTKGEEIMAACGQLNSANANGWQPTFGT